MKGAHEIRFGFDNVHHLMNHWQLELGEGPRGAFYFAELTQRRLRRGTFTHVRQLEQAIHDYLENGLMRHNTSLLSQK